MKTYLYRCYDRDGQLLYAGITDNVERRKRDHAKDKFWWGDVSKVTVMAFETRPQALWAEWAVITTCHPVYNRSATLPATPETAPPFVGEDDRAATPRSLWWRLVRLFFPGRPRQPDYAMDFSDLARVDYPWFELGDAAADEPDPEPEATIPVPPKRPGIMPPGLSPGAQQAWRDKFGMPEQEPAPAAVEPEYPFSGDRAFDVIIGALHRSGRGGTTAAVLAGYLVEMQWLITEAEMCRTLEIGVAAGGFVRNPGGAYALRSSLGPDGGVRVPVGVN